MTTYQHYATVTTRASAATRAAAWARPLARAATKSVGRGWAKLRPVLLSLSGLGCGVAAAFQAGVTVGLIAAAVACFVAEWRLNG